MTRRGPQLLTVPEVARLLRTSPKAIYNMVARGQLAGIVRLGRRVLFNEERLLQWLAKNTDA